MKKIGLVLGVLVMALVLMAPVFAQDNMVTSDPILDSQKTLQNPIFKDKMYACKDNCTGCYDQGNGCCIAVCVNCVTGQMYCVQCCGRGACTRVRCY